MERKSNGIGCVQTMSSIESGKALDGVDFIETEIVYRAVVVLLLFRDADQSNIRTIRHSEQHVTAATSIT